MSTIYLFKRDQEENKKRIYKQIHEINISRLEF